MAYVQMRTGRDGISTWRVGWREAGKQVWSPPIGTGEGAAEMKALVERLGGDAALRILEQRTGRDVDRTLLLRDWFDQHLEHVESYAAQGTAYGYRGEAARTWLPRLGAMPLDAITAEDVAGWVAWQRAQETVRSARAREKARAAGLPEPACVLVAQKTIRNAHGLLSSVLQAAVERGHIAANPARGTKLPADAAEHEMEVLTRDEWARLHNAIPAHWRPLTGFLLVVGCRIGEATAVQVGDLDLEAGTVRLRRAWKKGDRDSRYLGATKTRRGLRTVVMGPGLAAALRPLVEGKPADALVFTAPRGGRVLAQHYRNRVWVRALADAGITKRVTPHGLRHTSASWLLMEGVAPQVVQHRLGHESLATTSKVYAHLLTDAQLAAADVMRGALPRIEG